MKWRSLDESTPSTDTRPLQDIFAERKELIARYVPQDIQAVHTRVIGELKESRSAKNILQVGSKAPVFELKDHNGMPRSSADLLTKGRLVICFFRGRWCPFCVGQLEAMNLLLPQIEQAGASLIAISPQTVQQSFFMADQHKLRFPLAQRRREPGRSTIRTGLSRTGRPASHLSTVFCQSAFRQWRQQLGTAHPCNLHRRPRQHDSLCIRRRRLHPAAGAGGHSATTDHTPVEHSPANFNYDWIWASPHFGVLATSVAGSTS